MRARLVVASLMFAWSMAAMAAAETDAKPAVLVARIQILSQQLPLLANDAVGGNSDAFRALKRTHDDIAGKFAQLKQAEKNLGHVELAWSKLSGDVSKILEAELVVETSVTFVDEFDNNIPSLNSRMDEAAKLLADSAGSPAQILLVSRQELLAERMRRRMQTIRQGSEESMSAADGLRRDVMLYGVVLDGLIKGNADLGVKALKDKAARTVLVEIKTQWTELALTAGKLVDLVPTLQSVREATDNVRVDSSTLLLEAEPLFRRYSD
jgi:twitching motility protein PilJ